METVRSKHFKDEVMSYFIDHKAKTITIEFTLLGTNYRTVLDDIPRTPVKSYDTIPTAMIDLGTCFEEMIDKYGLHVLDYCVHYIKLDKERNDRNETPDLSLHDFTNSIYPFRRNCKTRHPVAEYIQEIHLCACNMLVEHSVNFDRHYHVIDYVRDFLSIR